jgi:regulator of RNase E activity RraA
VADDDGVVLLARSTVDEVLREARRIEAMEAEQAELIRSGVALRSHSPMEP